jgi:uncharacterized protein with HEPN domain
MDNENNRDIVTINKIQRYISELKRITEKFDVKSYNDLEDEYIALSSITQTITNINELKKSLNDEISNNLSILSKIKTNTTRNIASHNYDGISSYAVYNVMTKLMADDNINELEAILNDITKQKDESECTEPE